MTHRKKVFDTGERADYKGGQEQGRTTMVKFESGGHGVRVTRKDGTAWTDLAHVSQAYAEQHAEYLRRNLPGNPDCVSVEVSECPPCK